MAIPAERFLIGGRQLGKSKFQGFSMGEDGYFHSVSAKGQRWFSLPYLDSGREGTKWGRIAVDAEVSVDNILVFWVLASDAPPLRPTVTEEAFPVPGAVRFAGQKDFLLYGQEGRYLWIGAQLPGAGESVIKSLTVYEKGDIFLNTFPEIYQEQGSFFHRYLSIFSTLYLDLKLRIEEAYKLLDPDTAPDFLLPVYAGWLGISVKERMLPPEKMRRLVKEAPYLNQWKGTKRAVVRLAALIADSRASVTEDGKLHFTLLLYREADESVRKRLRFFIDQFKPVRVRYRILFSEEGRALDDYMYLDRNARLFTPGPACLNAGIAVDGLAALND